MKVKSSISLYTIDAITKAKQSPLPTREYFTQVQKPSFSQQSSKQSVLKAKKKPDPVLLKRIDQLEKQYEQLLKRII